MKEHIDEQELQLLHANAIKEFLRLKHTYVHQECLKLLMLAIRVVETDYSERDEAITDLEEFLR